MPAMLPSSIPPAPAAPSEPPSLSPYSATFLGADRAPLSRQLRADLWAAGLRWPTWIDARPGRLALLLADGVDLPLSQTRQHLLQHHCDQVAAGLVALGLALAAPRLGVWLTPGAVQRALSDRLSAAPIELFAAPAAFPSQPTRALPAEQGRVWSVPVELLLSIAARMPADAAAASQYCSVVGAVQSPGVVTWIVDPTTGAGPTPRQLVQHAGGATSSAWVALCGDPLQGTLWEADRPLPLAPPGSCLAAPLGDGAGPAWGTSPPSVVYILPARHPLIHRHRGRVPVQQRAANTCMVCRLCTDLCPAAPQGTAPHLLMRALGRGLDALSPAVLAHTRGCTACGACSVACPAELLPGALVSAFAASVTAQTHEITDGENAADLEDLDSEPREAWARLPLSLSLARLGLASYAAQGA